MFINLNSITGKFKNEINLKAFFEQQFQKLAIFLLAKSFYQSKSKLITSKDVIVTAINTINGSVPEKSVHQIIKYLYNYLWIDQSLPQIELLYYEAESIIEKQDKLFSLAHSIVETQRQKGEIFIEQRQTNDFHEKQMQVQSQQFNKKQTPQQKIQRQNKQSQDYIALELAQKAKNKSDAIKSKIPSLNYNRMEFGDQLTREIIAMKVKAFKQNKKYYYLIRNEDVYINLEDESVIKVKSNMDCAAPYLKPKFQTKFKSFEEDAKLNKKNNKEDQKINKQSKKSKENPEKNKENPEKNKQDLEKNKENSEKNKNTKQLKNYFEKVEPNKKNNLSNYKKQQNTKQQRVKLDYYFQENQPQNQVLQKQEANLQKIYFDSIGQEGENQQNNGLTSKTVRQTVQLTKRLCLFKECVSSVQDLKKSVQDIDDPEWLNRHFNFPDHCKYDQYTFQGDRRGYLQKLIFSLDVAKCYLQHGYGLKIYRKNSTIGKNITKQNYSTFIWFTIKMPFKLLQHYLIVQSKKPIQPLTFSQLSLVSIPLFRARQDLTQMEQQIWFKLMSAVFRINVVSYLTKNQLFTIYNAIRRKLAQRRDAIEFKLANTIQNQVHMTIKYYSYSEDGEVQFFGHDDGIQSITDIFDPIGRVQGMDKKKRWSDQFQLEFLKLYMQYRRLSDVKDQLLKKFTDQWYKQEFKLKNNLNSRFQRSLRRAIQFIHYDFKKYCMVLNITKINFYQKKFLTLHQAEHRVIAFNQFALQTRLMILDYYLNNLYGKNRNVMNEHNIIYRTTYINYLIQSVAEVLQSKKNLVDVMDNSQEERLKTFDLKHVKQRKGRNYEQIIVQQESNEINKIVDRQLRKIKQKYQKAAKLQEGKRKTRKRKNQKIKIKKQVSQISKKKEQNIKVGQTKLMEAENVSNVKQNYEQIQAQSQYSYYSATK